MPDPGLKRNIFQRIFGICATGLPRNRDSWTYSDGKLILELSRIEELKEIGSGIRIEGDKIHERFIVVHGNDGEYYAFLNRCSHGKRRLDPVPGSDTVQCCSVGKSVFSYDGKRLSGSAHDQIRTFSVIKEEDKLIVNVL